MSDLINDIDLVGLENVKGGNPCALRPTMKHIEPAVVVVLPVDPNLILPHTMMHFENQ